MGLQKGQVKRTLTFQLLVLCFTDVLPARGSLVSCRVHIKHITNNILVKQHRSVIIKLLLSAFAIHANKGHSTGNNTCCSLLFNTGLQSMLAFFTRSQLKRNCPWVFFFFNEYNNFQRRDVIPPARPASSLHVSTGGKDLGSI